MKQAFASIAVLITATFLYACGETEPEPISTTTADVELTLTVSAEAPKVYTVVDFSEGTSTEYKVEQWMQQMRNEKSLYKEIELLESRSIDPSKWEMHWVWELYEGSKDKISLGNARLVQRGSQVANAGEEVPIHTLNLNLPFGAYTLLAWADYVPAGTNRDYYYNTSNLSSVTGYPELRQSCTDNYQRDCFAKRLEFEVRKEEVNATLSNTTQKFTVPLTRPQGRYIVLASDYKKYQELTSVPVESNRVELDYPSFINVGYTVLEERPNQSSTGLTYRFSPLLYPFNGEEMICLADDYSFVNGEVSHIRLDVEVLNPSEATLSVNQNIDIPLYANRLTVVTGRFLTADVNSGGIGIDDDFDNEIIIKY